MKIFDKIRSYFNSMKYYVVADPNDNSMTLSKSLFKDMQQRAKENETAKVFVFRLQGIGSFAFAVNPQVEQETQLCDIQYNGKYKCIGFESLCPSVARILYDYHLPYDKPIKLSVSIHTLETGLTYYQIDRPHEKHIRKHTQA